jgi:hypothetical protein
MAAGKTSNSSWLLVEARNLLLLQAAVKIFQIAFRKKKVPETEKSIDALHRSAQYGLWGMEGLPCERNNGEKTCGTTRPGSGHPWQRDQSVGYSPSLRITILVQVTR